MNLAHRMPARHVAGGFAWILTTVVLVAIAPIAPAADAPVVATPANESGSVKKKPTIEELEQRILILEQKLQALQQAGVASVAAAPAAAAQSPATKPPAGQQPVVEQQAASATVAGPQIFAGPGGFSFQSVDGADQIRFHGEFDFDGRFFNDNSTPDGARSTWLLNRARPIIEGTFGDLFDFRFNPDFAGGKTVIQDAFVAARFNPLFVVIAGKFKEPFGLERLQLSPNNRFISLGLPSDLVPNRDLGVQVSGTFAFDTGTLTYQIGYFDGVVDGTSTDANATPDTDNNDKKDWAARLFTEPFNKTDSALRGLGFGVAGTYVNEIGTATASLLPSYKTETQRSFFSYYSPTALSSSIPGGGATIADGERLRWSPQAYYYYKSFGLLSEYVGETQQVARSFGSGSTLSTRYGTVKPDSWQVDATFLLTGDDASFGTVVPKRPYVKGSPGWGALEFAARFSELKLDSATFATEHNGPANSWFADPSVQARKASAWTLGLNWYLTRNIAWYTDFSKTQFDGGAANGGNKADESAFFTQFQVAF
jgi:phosphate-selective porin OprO/OprP